jgi:hypothetical protein
VQEKVCKHCRAEPRCPRARPIECRGKVNNKKGTVPFSEDLIAFRVAVDPSRRLATVTFTGTLTGNEIARAIESVYQDPAWQRGFDVLYDGTAVTELLLERTDQKWFVALQREYASVAGSGVDVILVSRELDRVMAEIYATMMKGEARKTYVCGSRVDAQRILQTKGLTRRTS